MLARLDGRVVFVAGAIPGERVRARVERANRQGMWARATEILTAEPRSPRARRAIPRAASRTPTSPYRASCS